MLKQTRWVIFIALLGAIFLLGNPDPTPAQAATFIVRGPTDAGWGIGPFGVAPTTAFADGPATPPAGTGSYQAAITAANSKTILGRFEFHNQPLSQLTALTYSTYRDPVSTIGADWYLNIYVDRNGDGTWNGCRIDFAPNAGAAGAWITQDLLAGTINPSAACATGVNTWAAFVGAFPNARFNAFNDPLGGAIRFNMGDTASGYVGYVGAIDNIRIAHTTIGDNTWDFEGPAVVVPPVGGPDIPNACLFLDGRINNNPALDCAAPVVAYCNGENVDVYIPPTTEGATRWVLAFRTTKAEIDAVGIPSSGARVIERFGSITVYRLSDGWLQINTGYADGKGYIFRWDACPVTQVISILH